MLRKITKLIETFNIQEQSYESLLSDNVKVFRATALSVDPLTKVTFFVPI